MDHGVDAAERLALEVPVPEMGQVPESDLNVHPMPPEPAWIADEGSDVLPGFE
jgi:hypothetical protein